MNALVGDGVVLALGRTILQSLWQVALVCGVTALALVALRRSTSNVRYLVACAGLAVALAAPLSTFVAVERVSGDLNPASTSTVRTADVATEIGGRVAPRGTVAAAQANDDQRASRFDAALPWLVAAWAFGVLLLSLRLLAGWWTVMRLPGACVVALQGEWRQLFERTASRLGIARAIRVFESATVTVPAVIGWMRPIVLLPVSALSGLTPQQVEGILAHELAHIRRHDYLVNLVQSAVETLLFYHPAVWWLSARIRRERENCCDDVAVAMLGDAIGYARALTAIEARRARTPRLAAAADGGPLMRRISRLRQSTGRTNAQPGWLVPIFVLLFITLALASTTAVRAAYAAKGGPPAVLPPPAALLPMPALLPPPAVSNQQDQQTPPPPPSPPSPPPPPAAVSGQQDASRQRAIEDARKEIERAAAALRQQLQQMDRKWQQDMARGVDEQLKAAQEAIQRALEQVQVQQPDINRADIERAMERARKAMRQHLGEMKADRGRRLLDQAEIERAIARAQEAMRRHLDQMTERLARERVRGEIDRRTQERIQRETERALRQLREALSRMQIPKDPPPLPDPPDPPEPPAAAPPAPPVPPPVTPPSATLIPRVPRLPGVEM